MGNKPSSLPPPITIDQFKKAFNPKTNGLADSVEKTKK